MSILKSILKNLKGIAAMRFSLCWPVNQQFICQGLINKSQPINVRSMFLSCVSHLSNIHAGEYYHAQFTTWTLGLWSQIYVPPYVPGLSFSSPSLSLPIASTLSHQQFACRLGVSWVRWLICFFFLPPLDQAQRSPNLYIVNTAIWFYSIPGCHLTLCQLHKTLHDYV